MKRQATELDKSNGVKSANALSAIMRVGAIAILAFAAFSSDAQKLEIRRVVQNKDIISIYYYLVDSNPENRYTLYLYSSRDQFTSELKNVTGAVGPAVECGMNNRIDFNVALEYGSDFGSLNEERLTFELRGELYVSFMNIQSMPEKMRRGKNHSLKWTVSGPARDLTVKVLKGGEEQQSFVVNTSQDFKVDLPKNAAIGEGYRIRVIDANQEEFITKEFRVSRKIPLVYQVVVPAAAVVAAIMIITYEPPPPRLPDPAKPD